MELHKLIDSPCIRQCTLDGDDVCVGCFRHLDEICAWSGSDNASRKAILRRCEQRRKLAPQWQFNHSIVKR
ncbi:DUF1289 domain-containing protein [Agarivorans sp. JK6]|uniref:DUF1289 domain-containing protein n=1 Tax=Agarivorans sp. JK6 TaxID=2997426 RepID=UPI00387329A4